MFLEESDYLLETLETRLTKPYLSKTVTLVHGSDKMLEHISPNARNVGTKLSSFRTSSFWCLEQDKELSLMFGIHQIFENNKNIKIDAVFNPNVDCIWIKRSQKDIALQELQNKSVYLHYKTMPTKLVGRGHSNW